MTNDISFRFPVRRCLNSKRADAFHFQPQFDVIRYTIAKASICKPLAAIANRSGKTFDPGDKPRSFFTYVAIGDVDTASGEVIKFSRVLGAQAPSRARKVILKGSTLVSTVRPRRRAFALVPDELAGSICSTGFAVLVADEEQIDRQFLWAFLRSRFGARQIERLGRGASYPAVLEHELDGILVPVPDRDTFQFIVSKKVSEIFALEQQAQNKLREALATLESCLPTALLERTELSASFKPEHAFAAERADARFFDQRYQALEDRMSKVVIEKKGNALPLGRLGDPLRRGVQPEYRRDGSIPVLKTVDVQNRKVNWSACRRVTEEFYRDHPRGQLHRGDIVITSTGEGSWGRAAIVDIDQAIAAVDLLVLRVNSDIVDLYAVLAFLWSEFGQLQFSQRVRGSTGQTHLYKQDVEKAKVLIPSDNDQRLIRQKILEQFALLDEAERLRREAIQDIENLLGGAECPR